MKYSRVVHMYRQAIQFTTHGLNDATCDLHQIWEWYLHFYREANIAIATGKCSRVLVLDIDNRNRGDRTLEELIATHGPLPETLEASTGGGGRHIFFRYPEDIGHLAGGNHRLGQGIDFKADGGYVVPAKYSSEWKAISMVKRS
jgi:bifunctional DNA primase/polymerase-like protein